VLEATDESVLRAVDPDTLREREFDPAAFEPEEIGSEDAD